MDCQEIRTALSIAETVVQVSNEVITAGEAILERERAALSAREEHQMSLVNHHTLVVETRDRLAALLQRCEDEQNPPGCAGDCSNYAPYATNSTLQTLPK